MKDIEGYGESLSITQYNGYRITKEVTTKNN
jgi:hypothetical protein